MKRLGSSMLLGVFGVVFGVVFGTFGCSGARMLAAGDHVPDVQAPNQDGVPVSLAQYRGRPLVVYFYPKDRTHGCTIEAHEFRTEHARFEALGAQIVGVSNDDVVSHKGFCADEALPFPLLADTDERIAHAFGVPTRLGFYRRTTFVIDGAGVVRRVFAPVEPNGHAREVLSALAALPPPAATNESVAASVVDDQSGSTPSAVGPGEPLLSVLLAGDAGPPGPIFRSRAPGDVFDRRASSMGGLCT